MTIARRFIPVLALLAVLLITPRTHAQIDNLDRGRLLDHLAEQRMSDLLIHFVQSRPAEDPVDDLRAELAQHRLRYADTTLPADVRTRAFEDALDTLRRLIDEHADRVLRGTWQTDLATFLLDEKLTAIHNNAAEFYEFGVPTAEQKQVFEDTVEEGVLAAAQADRLLQRQRVELPRADGFVQKYQDTQLFDMMINQYYQLRTAYYLALGSYYATLLPEEHHYYQSLEEEAQRKLWPEMARSASAERTRLLELADLKLTFLINEQLGAYPDLAARLHGLRGRVRTEQGRLDEAIADFDKALESEAANPQLIHLTSRMGKARATDRLGQHDLALAQVDDLGTHPLVIDNLLLRLLTVDLKHRLLLVAAEKAPEDQKAAAINTAYEPYQQLLNDRDLVSNRDQYEAVRTFIYQRWESSIDPEVDPATLPAVVVAGMANIARSIGQNNTLDAANMDDQARAEELLAEADEKLKRAVTLTENLLSREALDDSARATAIFEQASAYYYLAFDNPEGQMQAVTRWIDLADNYPDQVVAENAAAYAADVLTQPAMQNVEGRGDKYQQLMKTLLEKYPTSSATDNNRLRYSTEFLMPAEQYDTAYDVLAAVPLGHPDYQLARREMLSCLEQLYRQAETDEARAEALQRWREATEEALLVAERQSRQNPNDQTIILWETECLMSLSEIASIQGRLDEAITRLDAVLEMVAGSDDPAMQDVQRDALGKQIMAFAAVERYDEAVELARQMMEQYSDDAAFIIGNVVDDLAAEINQLTNAIPNELVASRKQEMIERRKALAETGSKLAQLLKDWVTLQTFEPTEEELAQFRADFGEEFDIAPSDDPEVEAERRQRAMELFDEWMKLPTFIVFAKQLRLAGKPTQALNFLRRYYDKFGNDPDLLLEWGEAKFAIGRENPANEEGRVMLIEAAEEAFNALIVGFMNEPQKPDFYWQSWVRRLQINDLLDTNTQDIPLRIRALRASQPDLGGEPYKSQLEELERKYSN